MGGHSRGIKCHCEEGEVTPGGVRVLLLGRGWHCPGGVSLLGRGGHSRLGECGEV